MSDIYGAAADASTDGSPDPTGGQGASGGGGGPQGPPQGGGPILAALQRRQTGPQVSAPGAGNGADSMGLLRTAIGLMQQALHGFPSGSQQNRDVLRALQQLSRHLPQGDSTAGVEKTQLMDLLRNVMRAPLLQRLLASQGIGGAGGDQGGGGQPGGPGGGGGGQPGAPTPSMPLPGS